MLFTLHSQIEPFGCLWWLRIVKLDTNFSLRNMSIRASNLKASHVWDRKFITSNWDFFYYSSRLISSLEYGFAAFNNFSTWIQSWFNWLAHIYTLLVGWVIYSSFGLFLLLLSSEKPARPPEVDRRSSSRCNANGRNRVVSHFHLVSVRNHQFDS